jgi:Arc/MetJ-type ribon-helix-helix transcriptional regulator
MAITIPIDIAKRIEAMVAGGAFGNEGEVLREAIAFLEHRLSALAHLREAVSEADANIVACRVGRFDSELTKRAVRTHLSEHGIVT